MLYYNFKNYTEFQELFGFQKHNNGNKSRRNKILLAFLKNKKLLHEATTIGDFSLLHISSMAELKQVVTDRIIESGESDDSLPYEAIYLAGFTNRLPMRLTSIRESVRIQITRLSDTSITPMIRYSK